MSCLALTLINMASNLESDSQNGEEGVTVESRYCASGLQPLGSCLRNLVAWEHGLCIARDVPRLYNPTGADQEQ